ncbi:MAG TPA: helix-hairpin-helix domain-containing protein [Candidatus Acidoferrales bacterium]|nr:helix-hairpin-helix domain-containing protein [Candidatus Acidoferrales bacterium]
MMLTDLAKTRRFGIAAIGFASILLCASLAGAPAHKKKPPAHPIDLNTATVEQLEELPGVGPVTAQRIVAFREKSGPLRKVEDLLAVPRITKARLEKLRPYVTVRPAKAAKPAPAQKL